MDEIERTDLVGMKSWVNRRIYVWNRRILTQYETYIKSKTKSKTETKAGEPARVARSALPVGRLTRFVSVFDFVFDLIYI